MYKLRCKTALCVGAISVLSISAGACGGTSPGPVPKASGPSASIPTTVGKDNTSLTSVSKVPKYDPGRCTGGGLNFRDSPITPNKTLCAYVGTNIIAIFFDVNPGNLYKLSAPIASPPGLLTTLTSTPGGKSSTGHYKAMNIGMVSISSTYTPTCLPGCILKVVTTTQIINIVAKP